MTQEDRTLLLKDLSARLPYKVKIQCINSDNETVIEELFTIGIEEDSFDCNLIEYVSVKPYLFPLSSMNEEQRNELKQEHSKDLQIIMDIAEGKIIYGTDTIITYNTIDWCNKHHFDYRGLIPKGLANDSTGLKIY